MQGYPTSPDPQQPPQTAPQPAPTPQPMPQPGPQQYPPTLAPATPPPVWGAPNPSPTSNQPRPPQSNRNKLLIGGGIGCGALLILCMCVGLLGVIAANGGNSSASGGSPTATQQQSRVLAPTSTPKPTATSNPNAGSDTYVAVVSRDSSTLTTDLNQVGTDCGSGQDIVSCRSALVTLQTDSESFLNDLDAHPAPPCLSTVDKPLRTALNDLDASSQEVIDGIDNYDVAKINDGTALMRKATPEIDSASVAFENASCS